MLRPDTGKGCAVRCLSLCSVESNTTFRYRGLFINPLVTAFSHSANSPRQLEELVLVRKDRVLAGTVKLELGDMSESLSRHAASVSLKRLSLNGVLRWQSAWLIDCLPKLIHLKEVVLEDADNESRVFRQQLTHALRTNGSLESIVVNSLVKDMTTGHIDTVPFFLNGENRSICERNRKLPPLLTEVEAPNPATTNNSDKSKNKRKQKLKLHPKLYRLALQCP